MQSIASSLPPSIPRAPPAEFLFFQHGGKQGAWQGVPDFLAGAPLAAAALCMALHHMKAADVVQRVLPHASFRPVAAFTSEGARASGHMLLVGWWAGFAGWRWAP